MLIYVCFWSKIEGVHHNLGDFHLFFILFCFYEINEKEKEKEKEKERKKKKKKKTNKKKKPFPSHKQDVTQNYFRYPLVPPKISLFFKENNKKNIFFFIFFQYLFEKKKNL